MIDYLLEEVNEISQALVSYLVSSPISVKQVFKDMEFLGWYTTGGPPDQSDIHIHKQVSKRYSGIHFFLIT